jgi:glycine oxidase
MTEQHPDVVIIGAGVMGLMLARELADAGMSVTIVERARAGREASRAAGGILSPLEPWLAPEAITMLASWSQARYPTLAADLESETGLDVEWVRSGMVVLEPQDAAGAEVWGAAHDLAVRHIGAESMGDIAPEVRPAPALWLPHVAQLRNPRFMDALVASVQDRGVRLFEGAGDASVVIENGGHEHVGGVDTEMGRLMTERVVITAGAWTGRVLERIGADVPIRPVRGQMIHFRAEPGTVGHIVQHKGRYVIPRRDGVVIVGSTVEAIGYDKGTTQQASEELALAAAEMVPALAGIKVAGHWSGLRPEAPGGVPMIGPVGDVRGLWMCAGHYRNGITIAPASTRLARNLVLGETPCVDPAPFDPADRLAVA